MVLWTQLRIVEDQRREHCRPIACVRSKDAMEQYICDLYAKMEEVRLNYLQINQDTLLTF